MPRMIGTVDEDGQFVQKFFFKLTSSWDQHRLNEMMNDPDSYNATFKGSDGEYAEVETRPDWA